MTTYNLDEIKDLINQLNPKCICGTTLRGTNTHHYGPHTSGIHLQGHTEKQWVYVTCTKCGYDMSLTKILKQTHTHNEKKQPQHTDPLTTQIPTNQTMETNP